MVTEHDGRSPVFSQTVGFESGKRIGDGVIAQRASEQASSDFPLVMAGLRGQTKRQQTLKQQYLAAGR
jgi:hypothetical protein